jgi:outer membrane protein assembly factor BamB
LALQSSFELSIKQKRRKRKISISKRKLAVILAFLMISVMIIAMPGEPVKAQLAKQQPVVGPLPSGVTTNATTNPDIKAFLSFRPNPVGVGQTVLVNVWTTPAPGAGRMHRNYVVTITEPDGTTEVKNLNTYPNDGTAWFEFAPDVAGTWKLKFDFLGDYFPAGYYIDGDVVTSSTGATLYSESVYYPPTSTPLQSLDVQQGLLVASWPPAPIPTDYWTRPVSAMNREWATVAGNYPWPYGNDGYDYAGPLVTAPNSAHIVWKKQQNLNGLVGGEMGSRFVGSRETTGYGYPTVIYFGRGYQTMTLPIDGVPTSCAVCYDIRTGEIFYSRPIASGGVTPTILSYTPDPPTAAELMTIGSQLIKIDPWTGAVTTNVTSMSGTFHSGRYVLTVQTNNTATGNRLINWTTTGSSTDFRTRIISNITWPWTNLGTVQDFNAGAAVQISNIASGGAYVGQTIRAANLVTGQSTWNKTIDEPYYSGSCNVADNGMVAVHSDRGYFLAFNLNTGEQVWQSETFDYPWDEPGFGAYDIASAYGLIFRSAYTGVYAVNWTNGKIAWKYEAPAGAAYETPYVDPNSTTVNSWNGGILVADGKVFDYNTEHSPSQPITRGWKLHAINATTGEGIWSILGLSTSRNFAGSAADGYLAFDNLYDAYLYVFGKGKTETTVTAPDVVLAKGSGIVIKGTVLDMSPAQPNTPCVSKTSMETQMEYLHMQMPIGGLWGNATITGIPVTLTAIDPNGNSVNIGTVTTNGYYGTFSKAWTPDLEGDYQIIASFAGDDSYGSSSAATGISVGQAPATSTPQAELVVPDYTMTIIAAAIGIIIAVVIAIAIVGVLLLRRRP